jgi:hypothetical protein
MIEVASKINREHLPYETFAHRYASATGVVALLLLFALASSYTFLSKNNPTSIYLGVSALG